ncbi:patatin-like phospholipase family protein [Paenibacillus xerothermodurans]|uniref:patatin-like phospholipase family protein n=1 Tax=Paenibacillus xerothermodurans TaxID=1977292 RepID=UPI001FB53C6D|nr:patatin-like phospholipase family protein [Paenibacillus xerothermodurans]
MVYPFRNLVFEGGGVKGIAYAGALEVLKDEGILENIRRTGGSSAGAIIALLIGLNYSVDQIKVTLERMNLTDFMDEDIASVQIDNMYQLIKNFGW